MRVGLDRGAFTNQVHLTSNKYLIGLISLHAATTLAEKLVADSREHNEEHCDQEERRGLVQFFIICVTALRKLQRNVVRVLQILRRVGLDLRHRLAASFHVRHARVVLFGQRCLVPVVGEPVCREHRLCGAEEQVRTLQSILVAEFLPSVEFEGCDDVVDCWLLVVIVSKLGLLAPRVEIQCIALAQVLFGVDLELRIFFVENWSGPVILYHRGPLVLRDADLIVWVRVFHICQLIIEQN